MVLLTLDNFGRKGNFKGLNINYVRCLIRKIIEMIYLGKLIVTSSSWNMSKNILIAEKI